VSTSPSLTADLRRGDETQTLLKLQNRGVTTEDFTAIGQNDALLDDIVAAIQKHRLFALPEEQVTRLLVINELLWKDRAITEEAIRQLGNPSDLDCPVSDEQGLYCITLLYETGNPLTTFERNCLRLKPPGSLATPASPYGL